MVLTYADSPPFTGMRPLNLARDAREVSRLLMDVFSPTLDAEGRRALQNLSETPTLAWRVTQLTSQVDPGFVYVVNGVIVGNVSIIPTRLAGRFVIANVAVHPDFRRQGIGRQLTAAALDHLRQCQAHVALLQVDRENDTARRLYQTLGFVTLGDMTSWYASPRTLCEIADDSRLAIRPLRGREARLAFQIDIASLPPDLNWPDATRPDTYKRGLWQWLDSFLNGRQTETWVVPDEQDRPMALASIVSEWGRSHMLALRVPVEWQTLLTRPLLAKVLRRLTYLRQRQVSIEHRADDAEMNVLLPLAGFRPKRSLTTMRIDL